MSYRRWTEIEESWLEVMYHDTPNTVIAGLLGRPARAIGQKARKMGLTKDPDMNAGRFPAGHKPWNKGQRWIAGGRSAETRFQPGQTPHTWHPVGTEVRDPDGYWKRKISDRRDRPARFNWRYIHRIVWEEHNGPIPEGHIVIFRDGDRDNLDPANLECISKTDNVRRNGIWTRYPHALAHAIILRGQLKRRIREAEEAV
ncbi:HNH endonuclease [Thiohalospira halophila DSM 15071]|uniref:HNH endonuclease n=1 Tax=Thiohalospira halophila DSM 15071 TaxID=1123397 RepID=A0A1I1UFY9_9GAMM|nr:HNH endonuclease signature motif containing protein [Thiohalospira halophila]SFD66860.1 HNH endonuclease [Thiohalospira halophila DSM 15071]